jgi:hypothetical protein
MRRNLFWIGLVFPVAAWCGEAEAPAPTRIDYRDLRDGRAVVIGALGVPLGTLVEIEATVMEGQRTESFGKSEDGRYRLRVTKVNRGELAEPVALLFQSAESLPATLGALMKQKTGAWPRDPLGNDAVECERGYVGTKHILLAYETPKDLGLPQNPSGFPRTIVQGRGSKFRTELVIEDEFPIGALERPWTTDDLVVARLADVAQRADSPLGFDLSSLADRPEWLRLASLRVDQTEAVSGAYRAALVARATAQGFDRASLERCFEGLVRGGYSPFLPVAAYAATFSGEEVWIIFCASTERHPGEGILPFESDGNVLLEPWVNRFRSVKLEMCRAKDGEWRL